MPPVSSELKLWVEQTIKSSVMIIFSKTTCPFCRKIKKTLKEAKIKFAAVELNLLSNRQEIQDILFQLTNQKTVPNVFVRGTHIGGCDNAHAALSEGKIQNIIDQRKYDYDLVVIGGGSGGLAASKEASNFGAKVAVLDFVQPTPMGTTWGLGGTCVNVGCIPKKLMHQSALLKCACEDAKSYGWNIPEKLEHNWENMVTEIQNHIQSLNWGYRVSLRNKNVDYINAYAEFIDEHTIKATDKYNSTREITSDKFLIATGERPKYPDIPGDKEYCITSDDLFSLQYFPGKTLVVGASYVALECAGFIAALGGKVTVMVRSIFLRGFDQQMANKVAEYMKTHGIEFINECVPTKIIPMEEGSPGKKEVFGSYVKNNNEYKDWFNTVLFAIGRDPCTSNIGLGNINLDLDKNGRVKVTNEEQTNVENVYAIGDIISGGLQLTPVAIQAGKNLARRLYGGERVLTDYVNVPTTVFTPLEYGCIGWPEEDAISKFGAENIEVFHQNFKPLEWTVAHRGDNDCYGKLICNKSDNMRVIGLHVLGPNAGEITQGYAVAMRMGATKRDFDDTIGIHPTCSETFTTLNITRSSGADPAQSGC
uniref:thioredoxin-disulfide reductase (NADPH) n=1 Tax=Dugesia japonica TaxID=6161 RepID=A0A068AVN2_DUGJA|nr:thioredoxin glutathione reductase [Dugesia japonica]